jgi:uncharacterized protein (TIGR01777 family)
MKVAVIGASGMIGSAVGRALADRGDEVVGIVRSVRSGTRPWTERVWDPSTAPAPPGTIDGCDAVINLAGAPIAQRWSDRAWAEIVASRVTATGHIADAVTAAGVSTLLNASAVGYYGSTEAPVDEQAPAGQGTLAELCAAWEAAATPAAASARVVMLRTGVVLDPDGGALAKMLTPAKLGLGGPIGNGRQWFPWVHIADAVGLIVWALDGHVSGPLNLVAPGIVRQREFAAALGDVLGRPAMLPTPTFALRAMLGSGASVVTEGQHVIPSVAIDGGYAFTFPDLHAALHDLLG